MSTRRAWFAVMGIAGLFYLAMLPQVLRYLSPVTGDEPFYIMTAISMIRDRNLDETSNYANRDYEEFYPDDPLPAGWSGWPAFPRTLPPHPAITDRDGLYTKHGLGLSALIAVPYEVAGRVGAIAVVLIAAIALAGQMFLLARESGAPDHVAVAASIGLAITLPIAPYALLIFPEVPAALLTIYATRRLILGRNSSVQWLLTGLSIGFLPWLHQRFGLIALVLGIVLLATIWRERSRAALVAIPPVALGAISIVGYNLWLYGQLTQNTEDHAGFSRLSGTINGAAGLLLDAQWGLFVAAPIFMVAIAAIPVWIVRQKHSATIILATVSPYLIVVAAYQVWWGEWGPPARYLVPVIPLLVAPLATWISSATRAQAIATASAWIVGIMLTVVGFAQPQRFYHHPDGINNLYTVIGDWLSIDLAGRLVSYQFLAASPFAERLLLALAAASMFFALAAWHAATALPQSTDSITSRDD